MNLDWRRVKDTYDDVKSLPPEECVAVVRERCQDDPRVGDEVLKLLASGEPETPILERPVAYDDRVEFEDLVPGTNIRGYIVIDRLGHGGMGKVFLARDVELQRRVALKCLLASASSAQVERERILAEARAAAAIRDTTFVAAVYHVVEHRNRVFIVMEYVDGETLATKMERERMPIDRVLTIGRQLASGLQAAHEARVVHRDIKPRNVQIGLDGGVKILDFGVARAATAQSTGMSSASTTGNAPGISSGSQPGDAIAGTPAYMSPEQLRGGPVDKRSDIFSLGAVLFEMVTGRRPFGDGDLEAIQLSQSAGVPRADVVDARVPSTLADIIARAMAADVRERFQTATELRTALDAEAARNESTRPHDPVARVVTRIAVGVPLVMIALALLGEFKTFVFNNNFGRTGPFARFGAESWISYLGWGILGFGSKLLVAIVVIDAVMATRILSRGLGLIGPLARFARRILGSGRDLAVAIGLNRASMLAQTIAGLGVLALLGLGWHHAALINAWMVSFNSAPIEMLMPMRESAPARGEYQAEFSVLTTTLVLALYKVVQLWRRQRPREGALSVALLAGVVAASFLMNEAPFRSFNYRDFERVEFGGKRCYITGSHLEEVLLLCPGTDPPRNHAVRADDPRLQRPGITENVFRGVIATPPQP